MPNQDDSHEEDPSATAWLTQVISAGRDNIRPWLGYWSWRDRQDKHVEERGAANAVLSGACLKLVDLRSLSEDPPDCEAFIGGRRCGIEVTELVHQECLEQSIKAVR